MTIRIQTVETSLVKSRFLIVFTILALLTAAQWFHLITAMDMIAAVSQIGSSGGGLLDPFTMPTTRSSSGANVTSFTLDDSSSVATPVASATSATTKSARTLSLSHTQLSWDIEHCKPWPKPASVSSNPKVPPTGIGITLAYKREHTARYYKLLCNKLPTQLAYFYEPQGLDLLLLLDVSDITIKAVAECLDLVSTSSNMQDWQNADGSNLTTHQYQTPSGKTKVYISQYRMEYPRYIQQNPKLLSEPMLDCDSSPDYIQGVRFYTDPILHLSLVASKYDYFIKIDTDIEFQAPPPFHMLWDMQQRNAVFGHAGEFPNGLKPCTKGIKNLMRDFGLQYSNTTRNTNNNNKNDDLTTTRQADPKHDPNSWWSSHWKGPCSSGLRQFDRGMDQYYTNLIIMKTDFFYSAPIRAYGRFMNEYEPGFFKYRWGDQKFWHIALGMFLGPDFRNYVADYTDLRCRRFTNCWFPHVGAESTTPENQCQAPGGIFYHGKVRNIFGLFNYSNNNNDDDAAKQLVAPLMDTIYENRYRHDCDHLPMDQ